MLHPVDGLENCRRQVTKVQTKTVRTKRLVLYAIFGFGVPVVNVVLACILEWKLGYSWLSNFHTYLKGKQSYYDLLSALVCPRIGRSKLQNMHGHAKCFQKFPSFTWEFRTLF